MLLNFFFIILVSSIIDFSGVYLVWYYLQIGTVLFLLILKPLIDFFCWIQLTNTSSGGDSTYLSLFLILVEMSLVFLH